MIGFSLWIISCLGVALWQIGNVCVVVKELVDHLLLHCPVTHTLWTFMLQAFDIHWVNARIGGGIVILLASMAWEA